MAQQNIFFPRLRQGKLGTRIDADGREVEVGSVSEHLLFLF